MVLVMDFGERERYDGDSRRTPGRGAGADGRTGTWPPWRRETSERSGIRRKTPVFVDNRVENDEKRLSTTEKGG